MKKWYLWRLTYIIVLPSLRGSRICNLWLSCINWRSALSTDVPLVDDIWTTSKTADLYVMFCRRFLFFVLIRLSCLFLSWSIVWVTSLDNWCISCTNSLTSSHALVITWKSVTIGARRGCCTIPTTARRMTDVCFFGEIRSPGHHWVCIAGVLAEITWMIYTYLNSAKREDSGYTNR